MSDLETTATPDDLVTAAITEVTRRQKDLVDQYLARAVAAGINLGEYELKEHLVDSSFDPESRRISVTMQLRLVPKPKEIEIHVWRQSTCIHCGASILGSKGRWWSVTGPVLRLPIFTCIGLPTEHEPLPAAEAEQ